MIIKNKHIRMKPAAIALLLVALCLLIMGCQNSLRVNINISQSESLKFSSEEINSAIDCVIEKFNEEFTGCTLTDLWYDEERSDLWVQNYADKNAIALLSNFNVDESGGDGSLNPNSTYTDWNWILIRDNKDGNWTVKDWGY